MTTATSTKSQRIHNALAAMAVGNCGIKWDVVVWRVDGGFIIGEQGVRRDGAIHDIESAVRQIEWMNERTR